MATGGGSYGGKFPMPGSGPVRRTGECRTSKIACSGSSRRSVSSRSGSTSLSGGWRKRGSGEAYQRRERPGKNRGGGGGKPGKGGAGTVPGPHTGLSRASHCPLPNTRGIGMKVGVPKETAANERRVALTPDVAGRLVKSGFTVLVERGAGEAASFGDEAYRAAGATAGAAAAAVFAEGDVVLKVQPPSTEEVRLCREGGAVVAVFQPSAEREVVSQLAARKVTAFSLALLPRITRAQPDRKSTRLNSSH